MKYCSWSRMYYRIGDWAYYDEGRHESKKTLDRRIARRRLRRELRKEIEEA